MGQGMNLNIKIDLNDIYTVFDETVAQYIHDTVREEVVRWVKRECKKALEKNAGLSIQIEQAVKGLQQEAVKALLTEMRNIS